MAWELRQFNRAIPKELLTDTRGKHYPVVDIHQIMHHILLRIGSELPFNVPVSLLEEHSLSLRHAEPSSLQHTLVRAILGHIDAQRIHSQSQARHWAIRMLIRVLKSST